MALIRARFLSLLRTTIHGAMSVSVASNIASFAAVWSSHLFTDAMSIGENFHCRTMTDINLDDLSTPEHGYTVDDRDDEDPVLLDREGKHIETWREGHVSTLSALPTLSRQKPSRRTDHE